MMLVIEKNNIDFVSYVDDTNPSITRNGIKQIILELKLTLTKRC